MSEKSTHRPLDENPASQRHWLYGFNAGVLVLVSVVVLGFLAYICESNVVRDNTKFDVSTSGLNSLSPGSKKMLAKINGKAEKYAIWSLFTDPSDQLKRERPEDATQQADRRRMINDLLQLYQRAGSNITIEDRGDAARDDIERQIRDRYQSEFKPYQEAVEAYNPLVEKLSKFLTEQAAAIGAFSQRPGTPPEDAMRAAEYQALFASAPDQLKQFHQLYLRETDSNLPDWGALKDAISETVNRMEPTFSLLGDPERLKAAKFSETLTAYFAGAADKYREMGNQLKAYRTQLDDLKPLKVQDVLSALRRNTVVVMSADTAKVIPSEDLFRETSAGGRAGSSGVSFNGEQAISSVLYSMANPDKVKVVLVTAAPQRLLEDMFSDLKQILEEANFEVLEWSPPSGQEGGGGPPPAVGRGVVWVVFPPEAPNMQQMMMMPPNPGPVIEATRKHMAGGGQVFFLAESGAGTFGTSTYPYAELIKDFGIEVQAKYTTQHEQVQFDPETRKEITLSSPYVGAEMDQPVLYAKHEITKPMEGLPTIFGPLRNNTSMMGMNTVVKVLAPVPTGVEALELVTTPYNRGYWASQDASQTAKFTEGKDLRAPVPLMAVAVKDKDKKGPEGALQEQRIAVLGSKLLGANPFLEASMPVVVGGQRFQIPQFPGNQELMKNTILWLAGYENMIAVSAKAEATARLGSVSSTQKLIVQLVVWLVAPGAALVLLVIVWAIRHR